MKFIHFFGGIRIVFEALSFRGDKPRINRMETMKVKLAEIIEKVVHPNRSILPRHNFCPPNSISENLLWAIFSHIDLNSPDCKSGNSRIGPFQSETQYLAAEFQTIVERKQSGNAAITLLPHSIRLVSASDRFEKICGDRAETLLLHCRLYQITYLQ
jgi:hypothetical protein